MFSFRNASRERDLVLVENTSGYVSPKSPVDLEVTFNKLCFSERGLVYRSKLSKSGPRISLWIEEKASLKQWSLEFAEDASDFGPPGVPAAAFFKLFTEALIAYDGNYDVKVGEMGIVNLDYKESHVIKNGALVSDKFSIQISSANDGDGVFLLTFSIRFHEDWENTYSFPLRPMTLNQEALLAGKLRNAEDELREARDALQAVDNEAKKLDGISFTSMSGSILKISQLTWAALVKAWAIFLQSLKAGKRDEEGEQKSCGLDGVHGGGGVISATINEKGAGDSECK